MISNPSDNHGFEQEKEIKFVIIESLYEYQLRLTSPDGLGQLRGIRVKWFEPAYSFGYSFAYIYAHPPPPPTQRIAAFFVNYYT